MTIIPRMRAHTYQSTQCGSPEPAARALLMLPQGELPAAGKEEEDGRQAADETRSSDLSESQSYEEGGEGERGRKEGGALPVGMMSVMFALE